ncbi:hypothetical protein [Billgrantia desiderata]|nr:hypothetical protein [Halomonas desiderata]
MMLDHLGEAQAAERLIWALESVTGHSEVLPPDLGAPLAPVR